MPHAGDRRSTRLGVRQAEDLVGGICFKTGPPRTVGVEVEWLVHDPGRPQLPVGTHRLVAAHRAVRALPLRSPFTVEPGGQLELSSRPAPSLMACVREVRADLRLVAGALGPLGLELLGAGAHPWCPPRRILDEPRYTAMESCFDRAGPAGRGMMCSSASVQVCLDAGEEEPGPLGHARRWALAHLLGPVLVAAFANSPLQQGRPSGWRSVRQGFWSRIAAGHSAAPVLNGVPARESWVRRVLDAPVMCVRQEDAPWLVPEGLTLRSWAEGVPGLPPLTRADLDYHLTTLFPPVRPRGHLELRMIDAQPGPDGWIVPLAVTTALFDDAQAAETAYRAVKALSGRDGPGPAPHNPLWESAARHALGDEDLREAAVICFAAAAEALPRIGADAGTADQVREFTERYVLRGRCPADDVLDSVTGSGGKDVVH